MANCDNGKRRKFAFVCAFAAWTSVAGVAIAALTDYASRPGIGARAPTSWPKTTRLARTPGRGTLVMVAHTKCSCTRASLHELARVMAMTGDRLDAIVIFVGPHEGSGLAGVLDLRASARAIPNVRVIEDESEARIFGAATSGQTLLYDDAGVLVFRGGLTVARGHEGDSAGADAVKRFVSAKHMTTHASEVFGCSLFDDNHDKEP